MFFKNYFFRLFFDGYFEPKGLIDKSVGITTISITTKIPKILITAKIRNRFIENEDII
jgi:hypothetical protein